MGDAMRAAMAGGPPAAGGPPKPPMEQLRSPVNPADAVMAGKRGQIRPGMTFGEYMEVNWGITPDMPMEQAGQIIQAKMKAGPAQNKVQAMAGGGGQPPPPPPVPGRGPGGIAGILGQ